MQYYNKSELINSFSEVYSLGMLYFELLFGFHPYFHQQFETQEQQNEQFDYFNNSPDKLLELIKDRYKSGEILIPSSFKLSSKARHILKGCLQLNPQQRISIGELQKLLEDMQFSDNKDNSRDLSHNSNLLINVITKQINFINHYFISLIIIFNF